MSGARLLPNETDGLTGPGWGERVHTFYSLPGAATVAAALAGFDGGRLVVDLVDLPVKCPVAPLEFCFWPTGTFAGAVCAIGSSSPMSPRSMRSSPRPPATGAVWPAGVQGRRGGHRVRHRPRHRPAGVEGPLGRPLPRARSSSATSVATWPARNPTRFDGHTNCSIETGFDKALLIDLNDDLDPVPGHCPFRVGLPLLDESRLNQPGKRAFEQLHRLAILPGRDIPFIGTDMPRSGKRPEPPDSAMPAKPTPLLKGGAR